MYALPMSRPHPRGRPTSARRRLLAAVAGDRAAARRRRDPAGRWPAPPTGGATCSAPPLPIGSFVLSLLLFFDLLGRADADRQVAQHLYTWFQVGHLDVGMDLLYDPLSALFLLLITGVGSPDPRLLDRLHGARPAPPPVLRLPEPLRRRDADAGARRRTTSALFLGWEGVGLASYLLIGFWQHKPSAAAAAKKAFVINRVGDIGMSLAIMLMFVTFGTTASPAISAAAGDASRRHAQPRSACCSCSAPAASPPRCRCRPGCSTRWRARPRCRR